MFRIKYFTNKVYFIYISVSLSEIDETIKCIFKFKIILDYMEVSGRAL
jgi:hypothetical protein